MEIVCVTVDATDVEIARLEALVAVAWEEDSALRGGDVEGNEFCLSGGEFPSGGPDDR